VTVISDVSDYQLKSACKDAICIAPYKVIQMTFPVLEDWYHRTVLTHSCKLVSFFYIYHTSHDSVSVVRTTFKVYGKRQTLILSQPKTPEPIVTKFE